MFNMNVADLPPFRFVGRKLSEFKIIAKNRQMPSHQKKIEDLRGEEEFLLIIFECLSVRLLPGDVLVLFYGRSPNRIHYEYVHETVSNDDVA
jgi:hypothetical protein